MSDFSITRSYPQASHWDRYEPDERYLKLIIQTPEVLPPDFFVELTKLVEKFTVANLSKNDEPI